MTRKTVVAGALAALFFAGAAHGQSAAYTWTGLGINVPGSSKCPTYKMTIDVTVDGDKVKGRFQQEGRPEREFETTLGKDGTIKTTAKLGGSNTIEVTGLIKGEESKILLDGYCKFEGKLTRK